MPKYTLTIPHRTPISHLVFSVTQLKIVPSTSSMYPSHTDYKIRMLQERLKKIIYLLHFSNLECKLLLLWESNINISC